jgi:hypothetical protein
MRTFISTAAGALFGACLILALQGTPSVEPAAPVAQPATQTAPSDDTRLRAIEAQLAALSRRDEAPPARSSPALRPSELERADLERRAEQDHDVRLTTHNQEPRDASWASRQELAMTNALRDVAALPRHAFSVDAVDCRSKTCVAQLAWPSEQTAKEELMDLLNDSMAVGCARQIVLPSNTGQARYQASMLIDCAAN